MAKVCKRCDQPKQEAEFPQGRNVCKDCRRERMKRWRAQNPELRKGWNARNKHRTKVYLHRRLLKKFGLTPESEKHLLDKQDNRCAVCERKFSQKVQLNRHHFHKLSHFDGFLCRECNHLEGKALATGDPVKTLRNMLERVKGAELFYHKEAA